MLTPRERKIFNELMSDCGERLAITRKTPTVGCRASCARCSASTG
jgi:hypothetical protein